jgi:fructuronate reductase
MRTPGLTAANLRQVRAGTRIPAYVRNDVRVGIVHFGPGAFHRAHQACYIDRLLAADPRWGICAVSLQSSRTRDALEPQDWLYTLAELAVQPRLSVLGALRQILVAPTQGEAVFAQLMAADTRLVTLTVTEKGYCLTPRGLLDDAHPDIVHDLSRPEAPRSLIGWLTEALHRRMRSGLAPLGIICCDNLPDNGPTLRRALTDFAARRDSALAAWIETEVACPRTMVDSITPATDAALRERIEREIGLEDAWPVQREGFTQWVIEDLPQVREPDWGSVGVTLTPAVELYERAKLRLVNGAHSTLAYIGLLRGHATVGDAMRDEPLARFVEQLMREDIATSLQASPELNIARYVDEVLARLRNPGVQHRLAQIACDGSKKLPIRLVGPLQEALRAGRPVHRLVLPIAAWMRFIVRQSRARVRIEDPLAQQLAVIGLACTGDARTDVGRFLAMHAVIPPDLTEVGDLNHALQMAYEILDDPSAALGAA